MVRSLKQTKKDQVKCVDILQVGVSRKTVAAQDTFPDQPQS